MSERITNYLAAMYGVDESSVSNVGNQWYVDGDSVGSDEEILGEIAEMNVACRAASGFSAGF